MSLGELRVWDGLWGVASVDMDCLAVLVGLGGHVCD